MLAMPQDGRVIVAVFVALALLTETNSAATDNGKCKHCQEVIRSVLSRNNILRIFEDNSSHAGENLIQSIARENATISSELDFVKFCMDSCLVSGDKDNDENNSARTKREVTEGIYKYFSPPFAHTTNDQPGYEVSEAVEEPEGIALSYENSRRSYQEHRHEKEKRTGCECVKEQEESVKRLIEMVEKYTERMIEHFRGMLREEIQNQVLPERHRESSSLNLQQNYFLIPFLVPNTPQPPPEPAEFSNPGIFKTAETTTAREIIENNPDTSITNDAEADVTTTETVERGTEHTAEITTEASIDLPEPVALMRKSENVLPPDCGTKHQDSPTYLPTLLQAFKPKNR